MSFCYVFFSGSMKSWESRLNRSYYWFLATLKNDFTEFYQVLLRFFLFKNGFSEIEKVLPAVIELQRG